MLFAFMLALCVQIEANNIYVSQNATGSGSSWSDALGSLTEALSLAKEGDQIWVSKGTYTPSDSDRSKSFVIPNGVKVYGGFVGNEISLSQRRVQENITTLSGEIGKSGISDNSFTIVYFERVNNETTLDGFSITAGNANGELEEGNPSRCGGAIYINGENSVSSPLIANCSLTSNFGRDGAAVYNNGRNGVSEPIFINCIFSNNEAGLDGGAVYNDGRQSGKSIPTFTNCRFERNMGTYGGAICNATESGICNLIMNNCSFIENAAYLRGGAVFSLNGDEKCFLEMSDCQFQNNFPDDQNMIFTSTSGRSDAYKIAGTEP